jgi:hypothetical protein
MLNPSEASQRAAPNAQMVLVAPSDTVDLTTIANGLLVTVAGNVAIFPVENAAATAPFPVIVGQVIPVRCKRVLATGTTATVYALFS